MKYNIKYKGLTLDKATRLSELFEKLAKPDEKGHSEKIELVNLPKEFEELTSGKNGNRVNRKTSKLHEKYNVEAKYATTRGRKLLSLQLNGFKNNG